MSQDSVLPYFVKARITSEERRGTIIDIVKDIYPRDSEGDYSMPQNVRDDLLSHARNHHLTAESPLGISVYVLRGDVEIAESHVTIHLKDREVTAKGNLIEKGERTAERTVKIDLSETKAEQEKGAPNSGPLTLKVVGHIVRSFKLEGLLEAREASEKESAFDKTIKALREKIANYTARKASSKSNETKDLLDALITEAQGEISALTADHDKKVEQMRKARAAKEAKEAKEAKGAKGAAA